MVIRTRWLIVVNVIILSIGFSILGWMSSQREQSLKLVQQRLKSEQQQLTTMQGQLVIAEQLRLSSQSQLDAAHQELKQLRQNLKQQTEQVDYYRQIMAPEQARSGVRLEGVMIEPFADGAWVHFRVVQAKEKGRRSLVGKAHLSLTGSQQGQTVRYTLAQLEGKQRTHIPLRLRFFADEWVTLKIPSDFKPKALRLIVTFPGNRYFKAIHLFQQLDWPAQGQG